jgi:hypothetical protein
MNFPSVNQPIEQQINVSWFNPQLSCGWETNLGSSIALHVGDSQNEDGDLALAPNSSLLPTGEPKFWS